jgi:phosphoglycolate phosphatase-like HAD superfamily hydrolase
VPSLEARGFVEYINIDNVLIIGDATANLLFALRIGGAKSVWCKYSYGDRLVCQSLERDLTVDLFYDVR